MSTLETLAAALRSERHPITGQPARDYLTHFQLRVLQDAYAEQDPAYWRRRAESFAAVGTPACDEIAQACRNRAAMCETTLTDFLEALTGLHHDDHHDEAA